MTIIEGETLPMSDLIYIYKDKPHSSLIQIKFSVAFFLPAALLPVTVVARNLPKLLILVRITRTGITFLLKTIKKG